jgi:hypothetical protein
MATLAPTVHERLARCSTRVSVDGHLLIGEAVENLAYARDGRSLRGVLQRRPEGAGTMDCGFARAELSG